MFGIITLSVFTLMQIYVFWRADSVPFLKRNISRKVLIGVGVDTLVCFFLGRYLGHGGTGFPSHDARVSRHELDGCDFSLNGFSSRGRPHNYRGLAFASFGAFVARICPGCWWSAFYGCAGAGNEVTGGAKLRRIPQSSSPKDEWTQ